MKFYSIGGYNEVGKNMSAIEVGNEVVIIDMGLFLDKIVTLEDAERDVSTKELINMGALPNDEMLKGKNVKAIVLSHGHLDHVGAVPRMAERYKCPIIGTPLTLEIVKKLIREDGHPSMLKNLFELKPGETARVSDNFEIEFVNITHSIPETSFVALHTKEGLITYLNDYKLDNTPTMGDPPDYKRLKQLGKEGIKLHINECVKVERYTRTPSERIADFLVKDAVDRAYEDSSAVIITSFASHIARIKSIINANNGRRKIVFLGRSLSNYLNAAENVGLIDTKGLDIYGRQKGIRQVLANVKNYPDKYLLVCTGNQGEPNSVLSRMAKREYKFNFRKEDQIIFSSTIIPNPLNQANRYTLEKTLGEQGVRIMRDVHVSGHASREDHRDIIKMLSPEFLAPSHGNTDKLASFAALAVEEGYKIGDTVRIMWNGRSLEL